MPVYEVVIIGAGAAGLAAVSVLNRAGISAVVLEGSRRVGGRVHTVSTSHSGLAVELGAEFIHGMPQASLDLVRRRRIAIAQGVGRRFRWDKGKLKEFADFWEWVERLSSGIAPKKRGPDQSWLDLLERSRYRRHPLRPVGLSFLEGFHAADPALISFASLVKVASYGKTIQSDVSFRIPLGYQQLLEPLAQELSDCRLEHRVTKIEWAPGEVKLSVQTPAGLEQWEAKRVIIAVPLPVLKQDLEMKPALEKKQQAMSLLQMGQVTRITFEFREPFWQGKLGQKGDKADLGFILAPGLDFATWWSTSPIRSHRLVGWAGNERTRSFGSEKEPQLIHRALQSLSMVMRIKKSVLESQVLGAYCRLWHHDPLVQGAYSYAAVGGEGAMRELSRSVDKTLYFAGEHCHHRGNHASVDGAIETGYAAAQDVIKDHGK